jgi:sensor domain CHASE-containing protein
LECNVFFKYLFISRFDALEKDRTLVNLQRVQQAFDVEKSNLSTKLKIGQRDDAYNLLMIQTQVL